MRISVYKLDDGTMDVFLEPSVGARKSPVVLRGVTQENVVGAVLPLIRELRRSRPQPPVLPG